MFAGPLDAVAFALLEEDVEVDSSMQAYCLPSHALFLLVVPVVAAFPLVVAVVASSSVVAVLVSIVDN